MPSFGHRLRHQGAQERELSSIWSHQEFLQGERKRWFPLSFVNNAPSGAVFIKLFWRKFLSASKFWKPFFVVLSCLWPELDGFDQHFQATVHFPLTNAFVLCYPSEQLNFHFFFSVNMKIILEMWTCFKINLHLFQNVTDEQTIGAGDIQAIINVLKVSLEVKKSFLQSFGSLTWLPAGPTIMNISVKQMHVNGEPSPARCLDWSGWKLSRFV